MFIRAIALGINHCFQTFQLALWVFVREVAASSSFVSLGLEDEVFVFGRRIVHVPYGTLCNYLEISVSI